MTQEDWKLLLPFVQAGADGKKLEIKINGNWYQASGNADIITLLKWIKKNELRIEPEPTFVHWTDEEVPLDAWYRRSVKPNEWFKIKSRFFHEGHNCIRYEMTNPIDLSPDAKSLSLDYEHSTDGCKTWKRCGKEVTQ